MSKADDLQWVDESIRLITRTTPEERAALVRDAAAYLRLLRTMQEAKASKRAETRLWRRIDAHPSVTTLVREANVYADAAVRQPASRRAASHRKDVLLRILTGVAFFLPGFGVPFLLSARRYEDAANVFMLAPALFGAAFLTASGNARRSARWFVRGVVIAFGVGYSIPFFSDPLVGPLAPTLALIGVLFTVAVDLCTAQKPNPGRRADIWWRRGEHVAGRDE